jgi:type II secretory ATPase GspE/PulE/Tfp pilus assembly ATPase PilB-like protein
MIAKKEFFCYTDPMSVKKNTPSLWTITDEETLLNAIKTEKVKHTDEIPRERFRELDTNIHHALSRRESEHALALITRGALGYGSSDIHFDTHETHTKIRIRIDGDLTDISLLSP